LIDYDSIEMYIAGKENGGVMPEENIKDQAVRVTGLLKWSKEGYEQVAIHEGIRYCVQRTLEGKYRLILTNIEDREGIVFTESSEAYRLRQCAEDIAIAKNRVDKLETA
jgi:hypothetical protein